MVYKYGLRAFSEREHHRINQTWKAHWLLTVKMCFLILSWVLAQLRVSFLFPLWVGGGWGVTVFFECMYVQRYMVTTSPVKKYCVLNLRVKGTVPQDFRLHVFFMNQFPQAPEYPNRAILNFFENWRRYSQLKVPHRSHWHWWQMEKVLNQKSFNCFVWVPLVLELTYR